MNAKTEAQIARMKTQTIGVEIEMNHITREKSCEDCRRLLRHRQNPEHRLPQRLLHLVGMGCTGQRMEIPERCEHQRTGQRKVRTGHTDSSLRGHRNIAGACEKTSQGRGSKPCRNRGWSSCAYWRTGTHTAEPEKPCKHHGKPREPDS